MIQQNPTPKKPKIIVLIVILLFTSLCVIALSSKKSSSYVPASTRYAAGRETQQSATPTTTKEPTDLPFRGILAKSKQLTDSQWDEYEKEIKGVRVQWTGYVSNVKKFLGDYSVYVCMKEYSCVDKVTFSCSDPGCQLLNKKQKITFEGEILSIYKHNGLWLRVHLYDTFILPLRNTE